jgi:hypothetical protein
MLFARHYKQLEIVEQIIAAAAAFQAMIWSRWPLERQRAAKGLRNNYALPTLPSV